MPSPRVDNTCSANARACMLDLTPVHIVLTLSPQPQPAQTLLRSCCGWDAHTRATLRAQAQLCRLLAHATDLCLGKAAASVRTAAGAPAAAAIASVGGGGGGGGGSGGVGISGGGIGGGGGGAGSKDVMSDFTSYEGGSGGSGGGGGGDGDGAVAGQQPITRLIRRSVRTSTRLYAKQQCA
jgi:hypothetical protein